MRAGGTYRYLTVALLFVAVNAFAQQEGKRVYQKDSTGNTLYHKQSWVIVKGQMCQSIPSAPGSTTSHVWTSDRKRWTEK